MVGGGWWVGCGVYWRLHSNVAVSDPRRQGPELPAAQGQRGPGRWDGPRPDEPAGT